MIKNLKELITKYGLKIKFEAPPLPRKIYNYVQSLSEPIELTILNKKFGLSLDDFRKIYDAIGIGIYDRRATASRAEGLFVYAPRHEDLIEQWRNEDANRQPL